MTNKMNSNQFLKKDCYLSLNVKAGGKTKSTLHQPISASALPELVNFHSDSFAAISMFHEYRQLLT